jgi:hypothetical protein
MKFCTTEAEMELFWQKGNKKNNIFRRNRRLIWNFRFRALYASPIPICPYHDLLKPNFQSVSSQNWRSCNSFMHPRRLPRFDLHLFHSKSRITLNLGNNFVRLSECLRIFFGWFKIFFGYGQYLQHSVSAPYSVSICLWQYLVPSLFPGFLYSFFLPQKNVKTNVAPLSFVRIRYVFIPSCVMVLSRLTSSLFSACMNNCTFSFLEVKYF